MENNKNTFNNDIAIIGLDCRFPGAENAEEFWYNLKNGKDSISFLSDDEIEKNLLDHSGGPDHPDYVKAASYIKGADLFDEHFFGYTAKEADLTDPQQRLFLECSWNTLESAGYNAEKYEQPIAVFAGAQTNTYVYNLLYNSRAVGPMSQFELATNNDFSSLSTRVAYKLNLKGPAYSIHTACSTGLAVVHLACQSLLTGECSMAIAGSVAINTPLKSGYMYRDGSIFSPDGRCVAFDAESRGTIFGSGIGVLLLKRVEDALKDGDTIYAVIKGTAANNDGSKKANFTSPGAEGQAEVITEALLMTNIDPESITMLEAHGTGTHLGDPIEVRALTKAYKKFTDKKNYCAIGSVKTNFGHLDAAAGMAGLIKTVLALKHKQIPPTLHFKKQNPNINFEQTPFYVNTELQEWKKRDHQRRGGVSAFGIGGTNIHVILEEAPAAREITQNTASQLLLFSAKTKQSLQKIAADMAGFFDKNSKELNLADIAFTLANRHIDFDNRFFVVADTASQASSLLKVLENDKGQKLLQTDGSRPLILLFPGIGKRFIKQISLLYNKETILKKHIDICSSKLSRHTEYSIQNLFTGKTDLNKIPALYIDFITQYALGHYALSMGLVPGVLFGIGTGEIAAFCVAEVISLDEIIPLLVAYQEKCSHHSPAADDKEAFVAIFRKFLEKSSITPPKFPILSCISGQLIEDVTVVTAEYFFSILSGQYQVEPIFSEVLKFEKTIILNLGTHNETIEDIANCSYRLDNHILKSLIPEAETEQTIRHSILHTIGELWSSGMELEWKNSFTHERRARIPLPTYAMNKRKHWISPAVRSASHLFSGKETRKNTNINNWFYTPSWKQSPVLSSVLDLTEVKRNWLLFLKSGDKLSAAFASYLEKAGQTVVTVHEAEDYDYVDEKKYRLNPDSEEDYELLLDDLKIANQVPDIIMNLWSIQANSQATVTASIFQAAQKYTFYNQIFLARSIAKNNISKPITILAVTTDLYHVTAFETKHPQSATVVGAGLVISNEYPSITCRNIDISLDSVAINHDLAEKILVDIISGQNQPVVAYRNHHRWIPGFERLQISKSFHKKTPLRIQGVYLITGGLQPVNFPLTEYLIKEYKAKIIFLNPGKEIDSGVREKLDALQAQYLILSANFSDQVDMAAQIKKGIDKFGTISGVIHGAENNENSFIHLQKNDTFDKLFSTKINGAINLYSIFSELKPEFFILLSSINSSFGELGQAHTCAGNCFLEAFARSIPDNKQIDVTSVSFDTRQEDIDQIKKSFKDIELSEDLINIFDREFENSITADEMIQAFKKVTLFGQLSNVFISPQDINSRITELSAFMELLKEIETTIVGQQANKTPRPDLSTDYIAPRNEEEQIVAGIWQDVLGLEKVGIKDNFFELGGHSLLVTYLAGMMREKFDFEVSMDTLYQEPTIEGILKAKSKGEEALADESKAEILDFLSQLSDEEAEKELNRLESTLQ